MPQAGTMREKVTLERKATLNAAIEMKNDKTFTLAAMKSFNAVCKPKRP